MSEFASTDTTIRPAVAQDRASIIDVARQSGLFGPAELFDIEATLDSYLSGESADEHWLIDDPGAGVAGIAYYAPERMTNGTWNLYLLAVHPGRQGQGRGAALVRRVEHDLGRRGARVLLIETSGVPDFAAQRSFYARIGYHQEARIRDFYDAGDDKIIFWKTLTAKDTQARDSTPKTA